MMKTLRVGPEPLLVLEGAKQAVLRALGTPGAFVLLGGSAEKLAEASKADHFEGDFTLLLAGSDARIAMESADKLFAVAPHVGGSMLLSITEDVPMPLGGPPRGPAFPHPSLMGVPNMTGPLSALAASLGAPAAQAAQRAPSPAHARQAAVGISPGTVTITMPDGTVFALQDWVDDSLFSAMTVKPYDPYDGEMKWSPFLVGRGLWAEDHVLLTKAHSNLSRSGQNGLSKDWEMLVYTIRASSNLDVDEPRVTDFLMSCSLDYHYNDKSYWKNTLDELIKKPPPALALPIWMRENLEFGMDVECHSRKALLAFQDYLRGDAPAADRVLLAEVQMLQRLTRDELAVAELKRLEAKLRPGREALFKISLGGLLKRTVV